ncbi:hypothetical protein GEMRC1_004324 [Eukaryota sp. GEM-RC1]
MSLLEFDNALHQFNSLKAQDPRFVKFSHTVFSENGRELDPNVLPPKDYETVVGVILELLSALTPYFHLPQGIEIVRFLIRRYEITKKPHLVTALITMALPYFETQLFASLIATSNLEDTVYSFLSVPFNKESSPPLRDFLYKHASRSLPLFKQMMTIIHPDRDPCRAALSFAIVTADNVIKLAKDDGLAEITPLLLECLRNKNKPECQAASCAIILSGLANVSPSVDSTAQDYWSKVITAVLKHSTPFTAELNAKILVIAAQKKHILTLGNRNVQRIAESKLIIRTLFKLAKDVDVSELFKILIPQFFKRSHIPLFEDLVKKSITELESYHLETVIPELAAYQASANQIVNPTHHVTDDENADPNLAITHEVIDRFSTILADYVESGNYSDVIEFLTELNSSTSLHSSTSITMSCLYKLCFQCENPFLFLLSFSFRIFKRLSGHKQHSAIDLMLLTCFINVFSMAIGNLSKIFNFDLFVPIVFLTRVVVQVPHIHHLCSELMALISTSNNSQISPEQDLTPDIVLAQLGLWKKFVPGLAPSFCSLVVCAMITTIELHQPYRKFSAPAANDVLALFSESTSLDFVKIVASEWFLKSFEKDTSYFVNSFIRSILQKPFIPSDLIADVMGFLFAQYSQETFTNLQELVSENLTAIGEDSSVESLAFGELSFAIKLLSFITSSKPELLAPFWSETSALLFNVIRALLKVGHPVADLIVASCLSLLPSACETVPVSSNDLNCVISCCADSSMIVSSNALDALTGLGTFGSSEALDGLSQALAQFTSDAPVSNIKKLCRRAIRILVDSRKVTHEQAFTQIVDIAVNFPTAVQCSFYYELVEGFGSALPLVYIFFYLYNRSSTGPEAKDEEKLYTVVYDVLDTCTNAIKLNFIYHSLVFMDPNVDLGFADYSNDNFRSACKALAQGVLTLTRSCTITNDCREIFRQAVTVLVLYSERKKWQLTISIATDHFDSLSAELIDSDKIFQLLDCIGHLIDGSAVDADHLPLIQSCALFIQSYEGKFPQSNMPILTKIFKFVVSIDFSLVPIDFFDCFAALIASLVHSLKVKALSSMRKIFAFIELYFTKKSSPNHCSSALLLITTILDVVPRLLSADHIATIITLLSSFEITDLNQSITDLIEAVLNRMAVNCQQHLILSLVSSSASRCKSIFFPAQLLSKLANVLEEDELRSKLDTITEAIHQCFDFFRVNRNCDAADIRTVSSALINLWLRLNEQDLHSLWTSFISWCSEPAAVLVPSTSVKAFGITSTADPNVDLNRWIALVNTARLLVTSLDIIADPFMKALQDQFVSSILLVLEVEKYPDSLEKFGVLAEELFITMSHWLDTTDRPLPEALFEKLAPALCQALLLVQKSAFGEEFVSSMVIPCIVSLMAATKNEDMWINVNNKLLVLLRSSTELQNIAISTLIEIYERLKEEALVLLPYSLNYFSEISEQSLDGPIHKLLKIIERLSGQSLDELLQ